MKKFIVSIVMILSLVATAAFAQVAASLPVRNQYAVNPVGTTSYTTLIASLPRSISGVSIFNVGTVPMGLAFGQVGSEVVQMIFPSSVANGTFFPLQTNQGARLSVIAFGATASTGELQLNAFFN